MALLTLLSWVGVVTLTLLLLSIVGIIGLDRIRAFRENSIARIREIAPYVVFLVVMLAFTSVIREVGPDISWVIGYRLDVEIHAFEGKFIERIQSYATPRLTGFFALVYVYGYVYLLVFPFLAYAILDDLRTFRVLTLAYVLNYVIGLACYIVFIAYGPRNFLVGESLLYTAWPESQFLTSQVNHNTNVFPSLHSSLSVTVGIMALRTRDIYSRWPVIAIPLALAVCVSTMYLGIHWATDVVAGFALAVISVRAGDMLHDPFKRRIEQSRERVYEFTDRVRASRN